MGGLGAAGVGIRPTERRVGIVGMEEGVVSVVRNGSSGR